MDVREEEDVITASVIVTLDLKEPIVQSKDVRMPAAEMENVLNPDSVCVYPGSPKKTVLKKRVRTKLAMVTEFATHRLSSVNVKKDG